MTLHELAEALNIPVRTVYNWRDAGRFQVQSGTRGSRAKAGTVPPEDIIRLARELEQDHRERAGKAAALARKVERIVKQD